MAALAGFLVCERVHDRTLKRTLKRISNRKRNVSSFVTKMRKSNSIIAGLAATDFYDFFTNASY
jgi:hypothetical protein